MKQLMKVLALSYAMSILLSISLIGCTVPEQQKAVQKVADVTDPNGKVVSTINKVTETAERAKDIVDALPVPQTVKAPVTDALNAIAILGALIGGGAAGVFKVAQKKAEEGKAIATTSLKETVAGIQQAKKKLEAAGQPKTLLTDALAAAQISKTTLDQVKALKAQVS
jgi:hypothetical protein